VQLETSMACCTLESMYHGSLPSLHQAPAHPHGIAWLLQEGTAARGPVNAAGELESGLAKACERCGEVHDLFYFPRRKTQLGGHWVHCFGCQHELRLIAKPPRQCVPLHQK